VAIFDCKQKSRTALAVRPLKLRVSDC